MGVNYERCRVYEGKGEGKLQTLHDDRGREILWRVHAYGMAALRTLCGVSTKEVIPVDGEVTCAECNDAIDLARYNERTGVDVPTEVDPFEDSDAAFRKRRTRKRRMQETIQPVEPTKGQVLAGRDAKLTIDGVDAKLTVDGEEIKLQPPGSLHMEAPTGEIRVTTPDGFGVKVSPGEKVVVEAEDGRRYEITGSKLDAEAVTHSIVGPDLSYPAKVK